MKHTVKITIILVLIFVVSQIVGLVTVNRYLDVDYMDGQPEVSHPSTIIGEPPEVENKSFSFIPIILTILIGTAFIFVLMHFKLARLWKYWFLFAVVLTMALSFGVYINSLLALGLAIILGLAKVYRPDVFVHNFTEIFIYTGITIAILPFLNLISAFGMLVLISLYDAYAVWKSKHMIKLAEFQTETRVFAGLFLPYDKKKGVIYSRHAKPKTGKKSAKGAKTAILGGGDIAFPLLFAGAVMQHLIEVENYSKIAALNSSFIIAATTTLALVALLLMSREERFYPAMPFISLGCIVGFVIVML